MSDFGFRALGAQQSHQARWPKPVFQVYQDASLSLDWTPVLAETCDARVRIPMQPHVRSMNLATSAALALGEALRQTGALPG